MLNEDVSPQAEQKKLPSISDQQAHITSTIQQEFRLSYDAVARHYSKLELPSPLSVCYAITNRCDKTCDHCMSASNARSALGLPTEQVKQVFERLNEGGVRRVDIVGGEPFIRKDLIELLQYITNNLGMTACVTTHGGLVRLEHAEALAGLNLVMQVSIDGSREINDQLRGKGSYDGAIQAIKNLVQAKVPVRVSCTIQRSNIDSLEEVVRLAKTMGATNIYINIVCAQGRASDMRDLICLQEDEERMLRQEVEELRQKNSEFNDFIEMKRADRAGVFIDTHGNFISQGFSAEECEVLGNVLTDDIRSMWKKTKVDHAIHLLQFLQHPLLYKQ